jgi:hypothetical protein
MYKQQGYCENPFADLSPPEFNIVYPLQEVAFWLIGANTHIVQNN